MFTVLKVFLLRRIELRRRIELTEENNDTNGQRTAMIVQI